MEKPFVAISGLIGAGKTTLANAMAKEMGLPVYHEPVDDNPYLADFYKDMAKHGFELQIYLLNKRFEQQQGVTWSKRGGVSDRSIYEDRVFAKMLFQSGMMDERNYNTYCELFDNMAAFMKPPTLLIHLDVSPEESLRRIQERARGCESGITLEYLQALHQGYQEFLDNISKSIPVIVVPWDQFQETEDVVEHVMAEYKKLSLRRTVDFDQNIE